MSGAVNKLTLQPILNPCGEFIVIIDCTLSLFKQRFVHFTFCSDNQFELLISASVAVFAGIVIKNVPPDVDVLSDPKSKTATDLFALLEL